MKRGNFITFEGGDGVGKTTQIIRLAERLRARGIACCQTREPGGTPFAERVRQLILDASIPAHPALAEAFLFSAARTDHVETLIRPALGRGEWVLCDRFADSTRAYQGAAGGVDQSALVQLEALAIGPHVPDLTLILDLDPATRRSRIEQRTPADGSLDDPFERRSEAFQERLRGAFLDIATSDPERCRVIDAAPASDIVADAIWGEVSERFALEDA